MSKQRRGEVSNFWMVAGVSALAFIGLAVLLWAPWRQQGLASGALQLYCAAGLREPVEEIIKQFHEEYGDKYNIKIQTTYGGSGELIAKMKIEHGKENHLFLSGDAFHMEEAQQQGLIAESIPLSYMEPALIVSSKTQKELTAKGKPVTGLKDLLRDDLEVMIGIPDQTAIGQLTREVLSRPDIDMWKRLEKDRAGKVTHAGTVNHVVEKVFLHDNAIGIAWTAVARQYIEQGNPVEIITVPEFSGAKKQALIGVAAALEGEQATAALQFARYLTAGDRGLEIFAQHNFDVPQGDVWAVHPEVYLSAGAMLQPGIEDVLKAFEQREGVTIHTDYAGCGLLVSKMEAIKAGSDAAPQGQFPDAYFACDMEFMDIVQQWFEASVMVSENPMVILVRKGNPHQIKNIQDLTRPEIKSIGLGHPTHSALGKLTDDLLKKIGLHKEMYAEGWQERIIHEAAGHDLVAKIPLGALDAAIVYESNARANPKHEELMDIIPIDIPGALAEQPFAVAQESKHKYLMRRLLRAIVAQQSADRFRSLGFKWVYRNE